MKANDEAVRETDRLEQLQDRFELWRRDHPGRHRLPQELWCAAAELAQQCGLYRTAKRLRLGYDSLKRHMPNSAVVRGKRLRRPKFVELLPSSPMAMAECSVASGSEAIMAFSFERLCIGGHYGAASILENNSDSRIAWFHQFARTAGESAAASQRRRAPAVCRVLRPRRGAAAGRRGAPTDRHSAAANEPFRRRRCRGRQWQS